ncbi:hypothetical protein TNCV_2428101 [Trichonephila clavipes]|nr:hypothetical protein TNCV_2428101 [Trichonephila clavipes]
MKQDLTLVLLQTRIKIREKNRLRKLWQQNRYPPCKSETNRLQREIKRDLRNIKQREWDDALVESNYSDGSLHKLIVRAKKKPIIYPPSWFSRFGLRNEGKSRFIHRHTRRFLKGK